MARPRKNHLDPVSEEMLALEEERENHYVKSEGDSPWWTTPEVAKALKKNTKDIKDIALALKIKDEFPPRKTVKWTFTDVLMVRRELDRRKKDQGPRDHAKHIKELMDMLKAHDQGEL